MILFLALFRVSSSSSLLSILSIYNFSSISTQISIRGGPLLSAGRAMFLPLADADGGGRKDSGEDGSDVLYADTSSRGAAANTTVSHYSTTTTSMYWWSECWLIAA